MMAAGTMQNALPSKLMQLQKGFQDRRKVSFSSLPACRVSRHNHHSLTVVSI
jgi:hypothetical protein